MRRHPHISKVSQAAAINLISIVLVYPRTLIQPDFQAEVPSDYMQSGGHCILIPISTVHPKPQTMRFNNLGPLDIHTHFAMRPDPCIVLMQLHAPADLSAGTLLGAIMRV